MSKQDLRKIVANFTTLILLLVCFFIISSSQSVWGSAFWWQSPKKSITLSLQRNQPVRFDNLRAAGQLTELNAASAAKRNIDVEVDGDDDWVRGFTISFTNTSNKNIVYVDFYMQFPETKSSGIIMGVPLSYGRYPDKPGNEGHDKLLKPGEGAEISLTDDDHSNLQAFLSSRSFNKVNSLRVILQSVIFDDDTKWIPGAVMRRDPGDPNRWYAIGKP